MNKNLDKKDKLLIGLLERQKTSYDTDEIRRVLGFEVVNSIYPYTRALQSEDMLDRVDTGTYALNFEHPEVRLIKQLHDILGTDVKHLLGKQSEKVLSKMAKAGYLFPSDTRKVPQDLLRAMLNAKILHRMTEGTPDKFALCSWESTTRMLLDHFGLRIQFDPELHKEQILSEVTAETVSSESDFGKQHDLLSLNQKAYNQDEDFVLTGLVELDLSELRAIDILTRQKKEQPTDMFDSYRKLRDWKIRYVYNTDRIEGNPLTYADVQTVLTQGPAKVKKQARDIQETTNSQLALETIFEKGATINEKLILKLHSITQQEIDPFAGEYKHMENCIVGRDGKTLIDTTTPVKHVRGRMRQMLSWIRENEGEYHPFFIAAVLHNQFVYIHPFDDGNGRVARLLLNLVLIQHDYYPIIFPSEEKEKYYQALRIGKKTGDMKPFVMYMNELYVSQLNEF